MEEGRGLPAKDQGKVQGCTAPADRPTNAPVPLLCTRNSGEFRKNPSSAAARALLSNSAVAWVLAPSANTWGPCWARGGSLLLLRDKSECKKAQRNTNGLLKSILQHLTHLAELQPLSMINVLHPSDLPASRSRREGTRSLPKSSLPTASPVYKASKPPGMQKPQGRTLPLNNLWRGLTSCKLQIANTFTVFPTLPPC